MKILEIAEGALQIREKRLTSRELGETEARARLLLEGLLLDRLGGHFTPRLIACGEDEQGPFVRMEHVPLPSLADRIRAAPLPADLLARVARAAFYALAFVHEVRDERGPLAIVHADPSPANILLSHDGSRVVLVDFNLASYRASGPSDGAFRGTIAYAAPEVARGERPTMKSDLFSLAASLLHARTGTVPRDGGTGALASLVVRAAEEPLLDEEQARAFSANGPVEAAIVACLAHDPGARPDDARAVLAAMGLC